MSGKQLPKRCLLWSGFWKVPDFKVLSNKRKKGMKRNFVVQRSTGEIRSSSSAKSNQPILSRNDSTSEVGTIGCIMATSPGAYLASIQLNRVHSDEEKKRTRHRHGGQVRYV